MITDSNGNAVWQWDNTDPFGDNIPNQSPNGTGTQFVFNLRFPGQYYDFETGTYYNVFRDYDPTTGRYIESDPIGLLGGQFSTYAYVGANPMFGIDPYGLADIVGRPEGFAEGVAWARKYKDMIAENEAMRAKLKKLCGKDRERLQKIFDHWKISVDPNIDNRAKRNDHDYADTNYKTQSTQFNYGFFNGDPDQSNTFYHEFRHLMDENIAQESTYGLGQALSGHPDKDPVEKDADAWARDFSKRDCTCASK